MKMESGSFVLALNTFSEGAFKIMDKAQSVVENWSAIGWVVGSEKYGVMGRVCFMQSCSVSCKHRVAGKSTFWILGDWVSFQERFVTVN